MIETKDLVNFVKSIPLWVEHDYLKQEYLEEIVARLERYDEMKEGIERMIRDCRDSSEIDTK